MNTCKAPTRVDGTADSGVYMNKYRARKVKIDGETFDSQAEYGRWCELKMLERAGEISHLERQWKVSLEVDGRPIKIKSKGYPNGRTVSYWADFSYMENNEWVLEDKKGFDTPVSRLKRAIVEAVTGSEVRVT